MQSCCSSTSGSALSGLDFRTGPDQPASRRDPSRTGSILQQSRTCSRTLPGGRRPRLNWSAQLTCADQRTVPRVRRAPPTDWGRPRSMPRREAPAPIQCIRARRAPRAGAVTRGRRIGQYSMHRTGGSAVTAMSDGSTRAFVSRRRGARAPSPSLPRAPARDRTPATGRSGSYGAPPPSSTGDVGTAGKVRKASSRALSKRENAAPGGWRDTQPAAAPRRPGCTAALGSPQVTEHSPS